MNYAEILTQHEVYLKAAQLSLEQLRPGQEAAAAVAQAPSVDSVPVFPDAVPSVDPPSESIPPDGVFDPQPGAGLDPFLNQTRRVGLEVGE